jgi:sugar phosphate isomerase/epimerase
MDRRKNCGRTAAELEQVFDLLPDAKLCFDIGHARQLDASMAEAYLILTKFPDRLVQLHVSEVDTQSHHSTMSYAAELAFSEVVRFIPKNTPLILESRVAPQQIREEVGRVRDLFQMDTIHPSLANA